MDFSQSEQASFLHRDLTCPVCLDVYRNPHLLMCGHNFCKACLDNVKLHAEEGHFHCPECRRRHRCRDSVQKNLKLASISDNYRQQQQRSNAVCSADLKPMEIQPSFQMQQISAVPCDYCPSRSAPSASTSATSYGLVAACASRGDHAVEGAHSPGGAASAAAPTSAVKTCLKCEVSMCKEHVKPHLELPVFQGHPLTEPEKNSWRRKCPIHDDLYQ